MEKRDIERNVKKQNAQTPKLKSKARRGGILYSFTTRILDSMRAAVGHTLRTPDASDKYDANRTDHVASL